MSLPKPYHQDDRVAIYCGDSRDILPQLGLQADACVTDPPYGLKFMGKAWDYNVPDKGLWEAVLASVKPGAHLLSFAGTRTQHRMAVNIEDAGFEIRDMIAWCFGSGFPKSVNIGKQIDKAAGADREVVKVATRRGNAERRGAGEQGTTYGDAHEGFTTLSNPVTADAAKWNGWGSALKPALEPITVARKPFAGPLFKNVLEHGTGALNIDACRVPVMVGDELPIIERHKSVDNDARATAYKMGGGKLVKRAASPSVVLREQHAKRIAANGAVNPRAQGVTFGTSGDPEESSAHYTAERPGELLGRWPANLIHDGSPEVLAGFPEAKGGGNIVDPPSQSSLFGGYKREAFPGYFDSGSAARFFYVPKADREDRDDGLEELHGRARPTMGNGIGAQPNQMRANNRNHHPTVKPTDLMRYLCRLVTPPGGLILDPFMGSGSTGKAAVLEGFRFIGIELDPEFCEIAKRRMVGQLELGLR